MLHKFGCQNFYSIAGENSIDFVVNDKAPQNDKYFPSAFGVRLMKAQAVIGPNASGKTNLLRVLPFAQWMIIYSFKASPNSQIPIKPFLFTKKSDNVSKISVEFEIDDDLYLYDLWLDSQKIHFEKLRIKNKTKLKITSKVLFERKINSKKDGYILKDKNFNLPKDFANIIRSNATIISTAYHFNHPLSFKLVNYWQKLNTNVVEAGWIGDQLVSGLVGDLAKTFIYFDQNKEIKKEAERLMSNFDIGLKEFFINVIKQDQGYNFDVAGIHRIGKNDYRIPFQYESSGTKQLFVILKSILHVLLNGGVAVIDEIDVNLHPDIVMALYELFISKKTNPHNAQLLFSTHSLQILGLLDKYQITLVEKNKKGESEVWRLDEMEGVRADDNYYTKYITGAYGAVPNIKMGE